MSGYRQPGQRQPGGSCNWLPYQVQAREHSGFLQPQGGSPQERREGLQAAMDPSASPRKLLPWSQETFDVKRDDPLFFLPLPSPSG